MSGLVNDGILGKELGPVTVGQILAMAVAAIVGLLLLTFVSANSILVLMLVAIVVYMIPHVFGASVKTKAVFGVVFAVIAIIVGGFIVAPAFVGSHITDTASERNGISYTIDENNLVTAQYSGDADLTVIISESEGVMFNSLTIKAPVYQDMAKSGSTYTAALALDSSKLYNICIAPIGEDGKADTSATSYSVLTSSGKDTEFAVYSTAVVMLYCMVFYYLILVLTTVMRRKIADTREKMEAEGRLYPQGYGRCTFCGAVVLPSEVKCRKCGAFIDRPDYMRPKKKNYLACSACGTEITADMTECPKCGAKFDGEDSVVTHADGTTETTEETVECPGCGRTIPATSEICVYCGHKFE